MWWWVAVVALVYRGWCGRPDQPGEEVDVNALSEKVASLFLCEGRSSYVTSLEAHQDLSYGSVRFVEGVFVDE